MNDDAAGPDDQPSPGEPTTRTATGPGAGVANTLGSPAPVAAGSWPDRMRRKPGIGQLYRVGVFLAGLVCVGIGLALSVLPGPLTIPPVLLGLWIWSKEFGWARRLFESFHAKGREAWAHAKLHPVSAGLITGGGLVAAGAAIWAVRHFELIARARQPLGL